MPTDRLSGPGKQRKSPGNGQNKWDDNQRLVLYLLFTEFNLQPDARTRLFNKLFQDHLVSCKSPNGLPTGALCSQYNERKKGGQAWARVLSGPKTAEEQAERERLIATIRSAATELHVCTTSAQTPQRREIALPITPTSRKRRLPVCTPPTNAEESEEDFFPTQRAAKRARSNYAPSSQASPTKRRQNEAEKAKEDTVAQTLLDGAVIQISPSKIALSLQPLIPVQEQEAHPPFSNLVFRYWNDGSHGMNSREGFVAGRFRKSRLPIPSPPRSCDVCWTDIENHLCQYAIDTPFVSVTERLSNVVRRSLQLAKQGRFPPGNISMIDTSKLDRTAVFHAFAYQKEACKKFIFPGGKQKYQAKHEYLIWGKIPAEAIIKTVALQDLVVLANDVEVLGNAFTLDLLAAKGDFQSRIKNHRTRKPVSLKKTIIPAMARLIHFFGLSKSSNLARMVREIIQGWVIEIAPMTSVEWAETAASFAHFTSSLSGHFEGLRTQQALKEAFLHGVRAGLGKPYWESDTRLTKRLHRDAAVAGLGSPDDILNDEMTMATAALQAFADQESTPSLVRQMILSSVIGKDWRIHEQEDLQAANSGSTYSLTERLAQSPIPSEETILYEQVDDQVEEAEQDLIMSGAL